MNAAMWYSKQICHKMPFKDFLCTFISGYKNKGIWVEDHIKKYETPTQEIPNFMI